MKKHSILSVMAACLLLATPALGQDKAAPAKPAAPELDPSVCREMTAYVPGADGSADYVPGVDVNGKPVVGADINPSPVTMPDVVEFDLTVDLAKYIGLSAPTGIEGEAVMGKVAVHKDGRVTYNGQPIEGDAEAALRAICLEKHPKPPLQKRRSILYNQ
jgi:hypothetical protein